MICSLDDCLCKTLTPIGTCQNTWRGNARLGLAGDGSLVDLKVASFWHIAQCFARHTHEVNVQRTTIPHYFAMRRISPSTYYHR